jgi:hypothetical protein
MQRSGKTEVMKTAASEILLAKEVSEIYVRIVLEQNAETIQKWFARKAQRLAPQN